MNILYLIGNGFDLHVGLKTAYPDFLKYYLEQPLPDGVDEVGQRYIKRLKEDIKNNIYLWSDLELQFGKHMAKLGKMGKTVHTLEEELDIINDDIREKLSEYIATQDKQCIFAENAKKSFLDDIAKPYVHLRDFERAEIKRRKTNNWRTTADVIDFITFNYTRTLEKLLGKTPVNTSGFELHEPIHVHGYYDQRMILGVNDVSQIDNEDLRKLTYATDALVKQDSNHAYGVSHTNICDSLISRAQLFCCYGLSFGDTDKLWWKKICANLANRSDVIIILFAHYPDMPNFANSGHKRQHYMRQTVHHFLTQGGIDESVHHTLMSRVFVSINDELFGIQVDDMTHEEIFTGKADLGIA